MSNNVVPMTKAAAATRQLTPSLPDKLVAMLKGTESPIVGPKTAASLTAWIEAQPEPEVAAPEKIEIMLAKLAMATKERALSLEAADARLDLFARALRGVMIVDLYAAFDDLLRTCTFMPTPAEVYQAASRHKVRREWPVARAKHLVWLHQREWVAPFNPEDAVTPAEIEEIKAATAAHFPSKRKS